MSMFANFNAGILRADWLSENLNSLANQREVSIFESDAESSW